MRFFQDRPDLTDVEWYWVPDDTPFIAFRHSFHTTNFLPDPGPPEGIGEVPYAYKWRAGNDAPPGQSLVPCGTLAQWQEGVFHPSDPPIVLDSAGRLPCCAAPTTPGMLPPGAGIWLAGADLDGMPPFASLQEWPNRMDAGNPAIQLDGGLWPSVARDLYGGLSLGRFVGPQYLSMRRPVLSPTYDLWCVASGNLTATMMVLGSEVLSRWRLATTFNLPLVERFTAVSRGTLPASYTLISPLDLTNTPVVVRTWYDGTVAGIQAFGVFEGVNTFVRTIDPQGVLAVGGIPGAPLPAPGSIYELLWYPRVLTAAEQAAAYEYFRRRYIP